MTTRKKGTSGNREVVLEVDTSMGLKVVAYGDTIDLHLPPDRQTATVISSTKAALETGTVYKGTTTPGYYAFVNPADTSSHSRSPFVAIVDPQSDPAAVASVGYRRDFRQLEKHVKIWPQTEN